MINMILKNITAFLLMMTMWKLSVLICGTRIFIGIR